MDGDHRRPRPRPRSRASRTSAGLRQRHARDQPGRRPQGHDRGRGARLDHRLRRRQRRSGRRSRSRTSTASRTRSSSTRRSSSLEATATFDAFDFVARHRADHGRQGGRRRRARGRAGQRRRPLTDAQLLTIALEINPDNSPDPATSSSSASTASASRSSGGTIFVASLKAKQAGAGRARPGRPAHLDGDQPRTSPARGSSACPRTSCFVADELEIQINQASGGTTPPDPLDWGEDARHRRQRRVRRGRRGLGTPDEDLKDALIRGEGTDAVAIDFARQAAARRRHAAPPDRRLRLRRPGRSRSRRATRSSSRRSARATQVEVILLRVGITNANVFVGMGVPGLHTATATTSTATALRPDGRTARRDASTRAAPGAFDSIASRSGALRA